MPNDKVSDDQLNVMIEFLEDNIKDDTKSGKLCALHQCQLNALLELKARREAERELSEGR